MDKSTRWSSSSCLVLNYGSFQRVSSLIQNSLSRSILFALSTGTRAKTMKHRDTSFARCFTTVSVRDMAHITAAKFRNKATLYTFLWHNRSITNGIALGSKPISRYISLVCYYIVYTLAINIIKEFPFDFPQFHFYSAQSVVGIEAMHSLPFPQS